MNSSPDECSVPSAPRAGRCPIELAEYAHLGQTDKGGEPYIGHCIHVAHKAYETALREGHNPAFAVRAFRLGLLHDAMEDCDFVTPQMIQEALWPGDLRSALLLTHEKHQPREEYIEAISGDTLASIVKRCDLAHNMDMRRINAPSPKDRARHRKYRAELHRLKQEALRRATNTSEENCDE
jgi:(p)ppGpp synthase/HD superfamily hydrolase